ncbi:uncharacterized protein OCT59_021939 [Rhizophagus irregularis]|uniref:uncharacterized protein n=1 Tax=Rhizophagus irregularis TaxID=588596 RepID=UPI001C1AB1C8|nr:hypothetical protein OCT59_021939 [Rhizophagus irregularis]CAB5357889.1 unnamed protein product [Rhizophagus irregularis]
MMVDELAGGRSLVRIITQVIGIGIEEAIQRLSKYSSPIKVISIPSSNENNDVEIDKKLLKFLEVPLAAAYDDGK